MRCTYEELREICGDVTHEEFLLIYDIPKSVVAQWMKNDVPNYMYRLITELYFNRKSLYDYIEKEMEYQKKV